MITEYVNKWDVLIIELNRCIIESSDGLRFKIDGFFTE